MRIIGGEFRGRKLISPPDNKIRPTTDRVREDIFNILEHSPEGLSGARILDVFAGTGALGLEAISRGAAHATFFDRDRSSLRLVKQNAALLGIADKTTLACIMAPNFPPALESCDITFIDPPYNQKIIKETLTALSDKGYLSKNCQIIIELMHGNSLSFPDNFIIGKEKKYGDTRILIVKRNHS